VTSTDSAGGARDPLSLGQASIHAAQETFVPESPFEETFARLDSAVAAEILASRREFPLAPKWLQPRKALPAPNRGTADASNPEEDAGPPCFASQVQSIPVQKTA
jgi:hypothetical protein